MQTSSNLFLLNCCARHKNWQFGGRPEQHEETTKNYSSKPECIAQRLNHIRIWHMQHKSITLVLNRSRAYAGVSDVNGVSCSVIHSCDKPMPETFYPQRPALYWRRNRQLRKQRLLPIGRSKRLRDAFSLLPYP